MNFKIVLFRDYTHNEPLTTFHGSMWDSNNFAGASSETARLLFGTEGAVTALAYVEGRLEPFVSIDKF